MYKTIIKQTYIMCLCFGCGGVGGVGGEWVGGLDKGRERWGGVMHESGFSV